MNGCEADYNKPPQKRLKRPLGENLVKLLFGLIQLIGSTHPNFLSSTSDPTGHLKLI